MERKMSDQLAKEFKYYIDHQDELAGRYDGKVIVIKNQEVIGEYDSKITALNETTKTHKIGTFLIQKCQPGRASYTQIFHSRVAFN